MPKRIAEFSIPFLVVLSVVIVYNRYLHGAEHLDIKFFTLCDSFLLIGYFLAFSNTSK